MQIGREVALARANLGLTVTAAARLAGVAPDTIRRIEAGDPSIAFETACRGAHGLGLKLWARAFPVRTPTLRDTGQLAAARFLLSRLNAAWQPSVEHRLKSGEAIDLALFGAREIIVTEIERLLADFQAQYRRADAKRALLADQHRRPVRLVLAVEDSRRNRAAIAEHAGLIHTALPAGSRAVLHALGTGIPLDADGLLWVRSYRR